MDFIQAPPYSILLICTVVSSPSRFRSPVVDAVDPDVLELGIFIYVLLLLLTNGT